MSLHNHNSHGRQQSNEEVIAGALGSTGQAPSKAPKAKTPALGGGAQEESDRIKLLVKKQYVRELEKKDTTDRIIDAMEYLRVNYPGILVQVIVLYWMCNPGKNFLRPDAPEVVTFQRRMNRCKLSMLRKYNTSFYTIGGNKVYTGFVRAYVNKEELSKYQAPRDAGNLVRAAKKCALTQAAVGTVSALKIGPDFSKADKEAAVEFTQRIAEVERAVAGYLPARPPTPPVREETAPPSKPRR